MTHFNNFGGDHDVLVMNGVTRHGLRRQMRFWAERGLIHCEDSLDNSYSSLSVRQFLQRVRAHSEMLGRSSRSNSGPDAHLREEAQRFIDKALIIAEKAQVQGMPSDASARRALLNSRKTTMAVTDRRGIL